MSGLMIPLLLFGIFMTSNADARTKAEQLFMHWDQCRKGQLSHCDRFGLLKARAGDKRAAEKVWRESCEKGYGPSCYNLGVLEKQRGAGNVGEVKRAWTRGCERGHKKSCNALDRIVAVKMKKESLPADVVTNAKKEDEKEKEDVPLLPLQKGNYWAGFEFSPNFLFTSARNYSIGLGLGYAPIMRETAVEEMDVIPRLSVMFAKGSIGEQGVFPIFQLGGSFLFRLGSHSFAGMTGGMAYAMQPEESLIYPYFGLETGWNTPFRGLEAWDRIFIRYEVLFADIMTHGFFVGTGWKF